MPEGPEVETIRRTIAPHVVGRVLDAAWVSTKPLRTPIKARALAPFSGRRVAAVGSHGKLLVVDVEGGGGVFVRLGMSGRFLVRRRDLALDPHTHVRWPLRGEPTELRFVDPRRFGAVVPFADDDARAAEIARMGPDGLALDAASRARVLAGLSSTKRALKDALLDQALVAGVGNIYASEALFHARLSPHLLGVDLRPDEAERLLDAVARVLAEAVRRRGTTFSDYVDGDGREGGMIDHLAVFQREGEPCPACGGAVARVVQGARSTFLCPRCQPRRRRRPR